MLRSMLLIVIVSYMHSSQASDFIYKRTIEAPLGIVYQELYDAMEENRFRIVYEVDIGDNLNNYGEKFGEELNKNKLESIKSMVFCNLLYANKISNADPDYLALCPMHLTLYAKEDKTYVVFLMPSAIKKNNDNSQVLVNLTEEIIKVIESID